MKKILELKNNGYTKREIGKKGFTNEQVHNSISRYNGKQRKLEAEVTISEKGRPAKDSAVTEEIKSAELRCSRLGWYIGFVIRMSYQERF